MRLIFLPTLIESLGSIHDMFPGIYGKCFEIRVRRPRSYFLVLFYCHTSQQTAVYTSKLTRILRMIMMHMFIFLRISASSGALAIFPKL